MSETPKNRTPSPRYIAAKVLQHHLGVAAKADALAMAGMIAESSPKSRVDEKKAAKVQDQISKIVKKFCERVDKIVTTWETPKGAEPPKKGGKKAAKKAK